MLVIGSTELVQTLIEHELVDEIRLMIDPVVLGGGKRIFREDGELRPWRLLQTQTTSTGAMLSTYAPLENRVQSPAHPLGNRFNQKLNESGELVGIEALVAPNEAKRVRAGRDGKPITDGVFPEGKEFLAGFWIVDVESPERAYELAAQASAAPGPGGAPLNMDIEVRRVMSGP